MFLNLGHKRCRLVDQMVVEEELSFIERDNFLLLWEAVAAQAVKVGVEMVVEFLLEEKMESVEILDLEQLYTQLVHCQYRDFLLEEQHQVV